MFLGNGAMTWTLDAADLVTFAYCLMGKRLELSFVIRGAAVGGVADTTLKIEIPGLDARGERVGGRARHDGAVWYDDAGTKGIGVARVTAGGGFVEIQKPTGANWTAGANSVEGQIALEVR
jgi:hypothetical protein